MSDKVHYLHGGGGGPEEPMLEQRVARLEADVSEIRSDVRDIRTDIREMNGRMLRLEERMGRMEVGIQKLTDRIENIPTNWTFVATLVGAVFAALATVLGAIAVAD